MISKINRSNGNINKCNIKINKLILNKSNIQVNKLNLSAFIIHNNLKV